MHGIFNILALSGSLRARSINSAFCQAVASLAPVPFRTSVYPDLGDLPLFNPDLETAPVASVLSFRRAVAACDALLIASPEYTHGISGVMKNALDWLVSFEGVLGKPVALVNTSPRAGHAYAALREVLVTMSLIIVESASVSVPLLGSNETAITMRESPIVAAAIAAIYKSLAGQLNGSPVKSAAFPVG